MAGKLFGINNRKPLGSAITGKHCYENRARSGKSSGSCDECDGTMFSDFTGRTHNMSTCNLCGLTNETIHGVRV